MKHEGISESDRYSKKLNNIGWEDYMGGWGDDALFHTSVVNFLSHIKTLILWIDNAYFNFVSSITVYSNFCNMDKYFT